MPPFIPDQQHQMLVSARAKLSDGLGDLSKIQERLIRTDSRLSAMRQKLPLLESAVAPILSRSSLSSGLTSRLDSALDRISSLLYIFESIDKLHRQLLSHDPCHDIRNYLAMVCSMERHLQTIRDVYATSLDWLHEALDFLLDSHLLDPYSLKKLAGELDQSKCLDPHQEIMKKDPLKEALLKLEEEFERLLTEDSMVIDLLTIIRNSKGAIKDDQALEENAASSPLPRVELMDPDTINKILVISDRLKANGRIEFCLEVYKEIRVSIVKKSMATLKPEYLRSFSIEELNAMKWEVVHENLYLWLRDVKAIVVVLMTREKEICERAFHTLDPPDRIRCFADIMKQSNISIFFRYVKSVAQTNHRAEALLVGLLDIFRGLAEIKYEIFGVFEGCPEILQAIGAMRKTLAINVARAYKELIINVETRKSQVPMDGGKDLNASFIVNYMGMIVREYKNFMEEALRLQQQSSKASGGGAIMDSNLKNACLSMMNALEKSLEQRALTYEDTILAHVFLMNNYRYVLVRLKDCTELANCLGDDFKINWRHKVDINMRNYIKKSWEHVVSNLGREGLHRSGSGGVARDILSTRVKAFNAGFEEVYWRQVRWVILDESLRENVYLSIIQLVIPAYHNFIQLYGSYLEDGVPPQHRVNKYTGEMLENMVRNLFQGR